MEQLIQLLQEVGQSFVIVRELKHGLARLAAVVFRCDGVSQLLSPVSILCGSFPFGHVSGSNPLNGNGPDDIPCQEDLRNARDEGGSFHVREGVRFDGTKCRVNDWAVRGATGVIDGP